MLTKWRKITGYLQKLAEDSVSRGNLLCKKSNQNQANGEGKNTKESLSHRHVETQTSFLIKGLLECSD